MALAVDLAGDEALLAVGDVTGKAGIWRVPEGAPLIAVKCRAVVFSVKVRSRSAQVVPLRWVLRGPTPAPTNLAQISSDTSVLLTGDVTGRASLWRVADGSLLFELNCSAAVRSVDMSGEVNSSAAAGLIATGNAAGEAALWDVASRRKLRTMACGGMVYSVDLSEGCLATGDQQKQALLWATDTGALIMRLRCGDVVKRVDLADGNRILAVGAGSGCELWDVPSARRIISWPEIGGRIKLSPQCNLLGAVNSSGRATLLRVFEPELTVFWRSMAAREPSALAAAAECVPSHELLMHAAGPSGRGLLAHAAVAGNTQVIARLFRSPRPPVPSSVLQVDCTGRHALDYALRGRNGRLTELLFEHALRMPPHARTPLVRLAGSDGSVANAEQHAVLGEEPIADGQPPALILLAQLFPHALQRQLDRIGLDTYAGPNEVAQPRRVHEVCLTVDHSRLAVAGSALPFESEEVWERLKGDAADTPAGGGCWAWLSAWCSGGSRWASIEDDDEDEGDTEVLGGVVGIPTLFDPPNSASGGHAIFEELVKASEVSIDLINTDVMRAAIGFKWQAFGRRKWMQQVAVFAVLSLRS